MSIFTIQGQECNTYINHKSIRRVTYKAKYIVKYKVGGL